MGILILIKMLKKKKNARANEEEEKKEEGDEAKPKQRVTGAILRFRKEMAEMDLPPHASIEPVEGDETKLVITIDLSKEDQSMWYGGKYVFNLEITPKYPIDPPKVTCATPIWHPNIDEDGAV